MQEEMPTTSTMASRLRLAPDASLSNPSFRNYYGVAAAAGSVPFLWESAPGTPKKGVSSAELPPLTPPPSYYNKTTAKSKSSKKLLPAGFVPKIFRRSYTMPSSKESVPAAQCSRRKLLADSPRSSFSSTSEAEDREVRSANPVLRDAALRRGNRQAACMACLPPLTRG